MAHLGHNIARIRGMRRVTQKEMAAKLMLTQPDYSRIEKSEVVDDERLQQIAEILTVSVDTIKNFDEFAPINIVSSTFHDNASINQSSVLNFNPIDKLMEVVDYNKHLTEEVKQLYERLLKEKDDVIEMYKQQQKAS